MWPFCHCPHHHTTLPFTLELQTRASPWQHPAFHWKMLLLSPITIFPCTPPLSCPHFWDASNRLLSPSNVVLSGGLYRGSCEVSLATGRCSVASDLPGGSRRDTFPHPCSISSHLTTPLFHIFLSPPATRIPRNYSWKTDFSDAQPLIPLPFLCVAGELRGPKWAEGWCSVRQAAVVEVTIRTAQLISVYRANEAWRSPAQLRIFPLIPSIRITPLKRSYFPSKPNLYPCSIEGATPAEVALTLKLTHLPKPVMQVMQTCCKSGGESCAGRRLWLCVLRGVRCLLHDNTLSPLARWVLVWW